MKFTGRIILITLLGVITGFEIFLERTPMIVAAEFMLFAVIAYLLGWSYDRSLHYKGQVERSEKRYRDLIELSPEPILVYQDNRIVYTNEKFDQFINLYPEQVLGKSIFKFIHPDYHTLVKERMKDVYNGVQIKDRTELKIFTGSGTVADIEVASALIEFENKKSVEVFIRDVTERNRLEENLRKNQELYQFITENSRDIITFILPDGRYEYISPAFYQILGYTEEEAAVSYMAEYLHPDEVEKISQLVGEAKSDLDSASLLHRLRKSDKSFIWVETNGRTIRNPSMELEGIVAVSRDVTSRIEQEKELKETNEKLLFLSNIDGLTGIPNRRNFEAVFEDEWRRAIHSSSPISVLMIDIDYFKNFNDHYGHQAGDKCIKQIANLLKENVKRKRDFVGRYGGEEFIIILPNTGETGASSLSENIVKSVRSYRKANAASEIDDYVTVSVGCATVTAKEIQHPEELLEMADKALYSAKQAGRNQFKVYKMIKC